MYKWAKDPSQSNQAHHFPRLIYVLCFQVALRTPFQTAIKHVFSIICPNKSTPSNHLPQEQPLYHLYTLMVNSRDTKYNLLKPYHKLLPYVYKQ